MFNEIASIENYPRERVEGMITAIQKPAKPKEPVEYLRPITLLSTLWKILALCFNKLIIPKLNIEIPHSQATHRKGWSTTENVFATSSSRKSHNIAKSHSIFTNAGHAKSF